MKKIKEFLTKKGVDLSPRTYFIGTTGMMTLGFFSSLIIGLILREIGGLTGIDVLVEVGGIAQSLTGAAVGVAIAHTLKAPPMVLFAAAIAGTMGNSYGGIVGAWLAALIAVEIGKLVSKSTKIDIIVTPVTVILVGYGVAIAVGPPMDWFMTNVGSFLMWATELQPLLMGTIIGAVMGIILTSPISSAAIAIMISLSGPAAGAAVAGGAAQMMGFAVASFRDNKVGGLFSQGLGTAMLQFPNIIKNPRIWIPTIIASAAGGALATTLFSMQANRYAAGMGTSGFVGQFGTLAEMGYSADVFLRIGALHFVIPAVISLVLTEIMRKKGWIKPGDMKIGD